MILEICQTVYQDKFSPRVSVAVPLFDAQKTSPGSTMDDEGIGLLDLVTIVWRRKWSIAIITALSIAGGLLDLKNVTYTYTAEMKVVPVRTDGGPNIQRRLAGLAAVAGLRLPSSSGSAPFDLYLDGLTSIETAKVLAHNPKVMRTIFSSEWDSAVQSWRESESYAKAIVARIKPLLGLPVYPWRPPGALRLRAYLVRNIKVNESAKSIVTSVTFDYQDRTFAKELLAELNDVVDERLRARALERADASIAYINGQLKMIQIAEYRQALTQALFEQETQRMTASAGLPFAVDKVSGPEASNYPTKPRPRYVLLLWTVTGLFIGIAIAFLRQWLANARADRRRASAAE